MHFDEYHHHRLLDSSQNKLAVGADIVQVGISDSATVVDSFKLKKKNFGSMLPGFYPDQSADV